MGVDAGTIYSEVRIKLDKLKGDISAIEVEINKFGKKNETEAEKTEKSWSGSFGKINLAGIAAFTGIALAVRDAVKTFATFEQPMANVASVAGASEAEFQTLEDAARRAGETTRFSAIQAADALYNLASAGLSATEATEALDGVLQLAGATGADLASTSATVTSTLSQYGLKASEAGRISNVFAAAVGNSQANMEKLSASFRAVGPVASALNISLETTTGVLQALYDSGYQGEQAGTALRNILGSLASAADPTVKKLEALGLSFDKLSPEMNEFADIIGYLAEAQLSAGDVMAAFGREAGPQMLTLLKTGKSGLEEYTKAVTDTTAAADMYARQNDTLQGSLDALNSATESAKISLVKELSPAIRFLVDAISDLVRFFGNIPTPLKVMIGIFAGGIPVVLGLSAAFSLLAGVVGTVAGPITLIVGGISLLTGGVVALSSAIKNAELRSVKDQFGNLAEEIGVTDKRLIELIQTARTLGATDANVELVVRKIKALQDELSLTDKEMKSLINSARVMGATDANIDQVVLSLSNLEKESGLARDKVLKLSEALKITGLPEEYDELSWKIEDIARSWGITEKQVRAIVLETQELSSLQRSHLIDMDKVHSLRMAELGAVEDLVTRMERQKKIASEIAAAKEAETAKEIARKEELVRQAEEAAILERANVEAQIATRKSAESEYQNALRRTQELRQLGYLTDIEANDRMIVASKRLIETLNEVGYDGLRGERGDQAIQRALSLISDLTEKNKELKAVQTETGDEFKDISSKIAEYDTKLKNLNATAEQRIEISRKLAKEEIENSKATNDQKKEAIKALDAYYDKLKEKDAFSDGMKNAQQYAQQIVGMMQGLFNSIDNLSKASANKRISHIQDALEAHVEALNEMRAEEQSLLDARLEQIDAELYARLEAEGLLQETKLERLQRELEEAKAAGDTETVARLEQEIKREQIEKEFHDKKAAAEKESAEATKKIEEEAAARQAKLEREKAHLEYEAALASWRLGIVMAVANAALAIVMCFAQLGPIPGAIAAIVVGVTSALSIAAMVASRPKPPAFATGGFVVPSGPGGRQITVAENGHPEMMLNAGPEGEGLIDKFASKIGQRISGNSSGGQVNIKLIVDGRFWAEAASHYYNNGEVLLEIAQ